MEQLFPGVWQEGDTLYTQNMVPGEQVYGEKLVKRDGVEYRRWDPSRSKLGAAISKGLEDLPIGPDSQVLYLGAASGTTPSHVSDIATDGMVYGVEYSDKVVRSLLELSEDRTNLAPILADARKPDSYAGLVDRGMDVVFQDVAQPDQFEIIRRNCDMFLRDGGEALIAVKARSISSSDPVEQVLHEQKKKFEEAFDVAWHSRLEPYEKDHMFFHLRGQG